MAAITGRITDQNGQPLYGANVFFSDENGKIGNPPVGTITDPDGYYRFATLGNYYITVKHQGFKTQTKSVDITQFGAGGGYTQVIGFNLEQSGTLLPTFEVVAHVKNWAQENKLMAYSVLAVLGISVGIAIWGTSSKKK